jgi:DNA repair protein RecO (recombination protein O)
MPSYNATSLVLRRTDLGENDRILTLFTREKGKVSAVAKGSRKPASRLSGATELFIMARLQLGVGRSLDIVSQCEIEQSFQGLRSDLQRLSRAAYFCDLLDKFTGDRDSASSEELFDLTVGALLLLQRAGRYLDGVVHAYELQLLSTVGYAPVVDACLVCGGNLERGGVGFSPSLGGTICSADRFRANDATALSPEALQLLTRLQTVDPGEAIALAPSPRAAAEVAKAMRWFVRFRSERALKTADFLDQLRASEN